MRRCNLPFPPSRWSAESRSSGGLRKSRQSSGLPSLLFLLALLAGCADGIPTEAPLTPEPADEVVPHPMNANPPPVVGSRSVSAAAIDAPAIISNGTIQLGVHPEGDLNVGGGTPAAEVGTTVVGVRFVPTNGDGTSPGCLCEGWGVADASTGVTGYANNATGDANITVESFEATESTAVSIVTIGTTFRVTHTYRPAPETENLYEVEVTIENISDSDVGDLRYRRVMDWDIAPNTFSEFVTIQGTEGADNVLFASDNGFATGDPLGFRGQLLFTGDEVDSGPADHGALFDFGFGELAAGESRTLVIFYGAAEDETAALNALGQVGAEIYSFGQGNWNGEGEPFEFPPGGTFGAETGEPHTFIFAFEGVGGEPVVNPPTADAGGPYEGAPGATITFDGSGSTAADGKSIDSYEWDFGDGSSGTGVSPTHTYEAPGTFTVTLTVTDSEGLTDEDEATVTIAEPGNEPPTAEITSPADGATFTEGDNIDFAGSGTDPEDGDLTGDALVWTSDLDGEIGTGASFSLNTLSVGTHTITLTATDSEGATGTDQVEITVVEEPPPPPEEEEIEIDVIPGVVPNELDLAGGLLLVGILGSSDFDPSEVDLASIRLGDGEGPDVQIPNENEEEFVVELRDLNGDGITDLLLGYCIPDLVESGDLTESSTELVLRAQLEDGTRIRGTDQVVVTSGSE